MSFYVICEKKKKILRQNWIQNVKRYRNFRNWFLLRRDFFDKKKKNCSICNLFYTNTFYTNANSHYNQNLDKFSSVKYYSNIFTNQCVHVLLYCWILGYRRQINLFFSIFIVSYPMLQDKYTRICCNQYEGQPRMIDAN